MSDDIPQEQLAPYKIEPARSSRSKCKTCRRSIEKGKLRLGILIEGPFGTGYLWHHLTCAARRRFEDVEAAYEERAWAEEVDVPSLEELAKLREKAEEARKKKKEIPYAERAPTGRSKCKHCGEPIAQGGWRIVLGRGVEFGRQVRTNPINVHPSCVRAELLAEDCTTEVEGFEEALKTNSTGLAAAEAEECLAAIGEL
jgi:hypothetical protein